MYRPNKATETTLTSVDKVQGEPIEHKIERITENGEAITDGAPEIFTDKSEGVNSAYDIRTDRWEIAAEAMDKIHRSKTAKKDDKPTLGSKEETEKKDAKVIKMDGEPESKNGTTEN